MLRFLSFFLSFFLLCAICQPLIYAQPTPGAPTPPNVTLYSYDLKPNSTVSVGTTIFASAKGFAENHDNFKVRVFQDVLIARETSPGVWTQVGTTGTSNFDLAPGAVGYTSTSTPAVTLNTPGNYGVFCGMNAFKLTMSGGQWILTPPPQSSYVSVQFVVQ